MATSEGRPGEPSERWAGDPRFANEPQAKALDVERSALPVTAPGVSPRSNEEIRADLAYIEGGVGIQGPLDVTSAAHRLLADVPALLVEREDQDRKAFCPTCGNHHPVIHHGCCANAEADREDQDRRIEELTARAVAAEARAEKAEGKLTSWREGHAALVTATNCIESERDELRAKVAAVEALCVEDLTEPDEDGERCERLLYPRTVRAALAAASPGDEESAT